MRFLPLIISFTLLLSPLPVFASPFTGAVQIAGSLGPRIFNQNLSVERVPNDARFPVQWNLARIQASAAWEITTGNPNTVIAVIDTGVNERHEELVGRLWVNQDEAPNNNLDDDGNGFIDDYNGYNFLSENGDLSDRNGHGTGVTSIIAANTNNGVGIAGLNWQARLMVLKALDQAGSGDYQTVARALRYAADNGATLVNMSFGTDTDSGFLRSAVDYAISRGVVLVAAAGNNRGPVYFPAAYSNVVGVGAVDQDNFKPAFANFGAGLTLVAPGTGVLVADHKGVNTYALASGTSFAAAQVTGALSLLQALSPVRAPAAVELLRRSATSLLPSEYFGSGLLNLPALLQLATPLSPLNLSYAPSYAVADGLARISLSLEAPASAGQRATLTLSGSNNIVNGRQLGNSFDLGLLDAAGRLSFSLASTKAEEKELALAVAGRQSSRLRVNFVSLGPVWRYLMVRRGGAVLFNEGEETELWVELKNTGNIAWLGVGGSPSGQVKLGTSRLRDRVSLLKHHSWLSENRTVAVEPAVVLPGEVGTFRFRVQGNRSGSWREYFQLVAEYLSWLEGPALFWDLTVRPASTASLSARLVGQGVILGGASPIFWADYLNTGRSTWSSQGLPGEVRLGTTGPQDRTSMLFSPAWLSPNRAARLERDVIPSQIGHFQFVGPLPAGGVKESFRLVAEFVSWFGAEVTFALSG